MGQQRRVLDSFLTRQQKKIKTLLKHFSITAICSSEAGYTVVINFLSVPHSFAINWQLRSTFSPRHKSKTKYNYKLRRPREASNSFCRIE